MIGWLDAQAGASGDMLLGALVDAGVPLQVLQDAVDVLDLDITLQVRDVERGGIGALKVDVLAEDDQQHRSWSDIKNLLDRVQLPLAYRAFELLASAESAIHRVPVDDVHFHEVGGHDALADIVGTAAGFAHLGLLALHCSVVSLGSGTTRGAHGPLPVPAPAVLKLLEGARVQAGASPHEMTTPTGAALLKAHVSSWGALPPLVPVRTGYGAGGRDPVEVANVLRLVLGDDIGEDIGGGQQTDLLLETNVDDLDPRLWPHVLQQLLTAGASDAWLTPILMKKGRPAHTLSVLCHAAVSGAVREVVFQETSTIGLREQPVAKQALARTESTVEVGGQPIRVKTAWLDGTPVNANPEWEDVLAAATVLSRPAKEVLAEAITAIWRTSTAP